MRPMGETPVPCKYAHTRKWTKNFLCAKVVIWINCCTPQGPAVPAEEAGQPTWRRVYQIRRITSYKLNCNRGTKLHMSVHEECGRLQLKGQEDSDGAITKAWQWVKQKRRRVHVPVTKDTSAVKNCRAPLHFNIRDSFNCTYHLDQEMRLFCSWEWHALYKWDGISQLMMDLVEAVLYCNMNLGIHSFDYCTYTFLIVRTSHTSDVWMTDERWIEGDFYLVAGTVFMMVEWTGLAVRLSLIGDQWSGLGDQWSPKLYIIFIIFLCFPGSHWITSKFENGSRIETTFEKGYAIPF